MARKVLISFLGTGSLNKDNQATRVYKTAKYKIEEKSYETPFVTSVLADHFKIDKFILIGTMKSMWEEVYRYFSKKDDDYYWVLAETTDSSNFETLPDNSLFYQLEENMGKDSRILIIKYGLNEEELNYNLKVIKQIEGELNEGDEIYLDITHSFRSLSLFLMTSIMYIRDVSNKQINIQGVYYGMLDVINELGYAPIVNLKLVDDTLNWIKGAYTFKNFGNAELITKLLGTDNEIAKKLTNFSNAVSINYATIIKDQIEKFKKLGFDKLQVPASLVVPQVIEGFTEMFKNAKTDSQFQVELADWYAQKHIYSSAYIVLVEALITYVCENQVDFKNDISKPSNRIKAKQIISDGKFSEIEKKYFNTVYEIRNDIGHSSIGKRSSMLQDIDSLFERIKKAKKIIYQ